MPTVEPTRPHGDPHQRDVGLGMRAQGEWRSANFRGDNSPCSLLTISSFGPQKPSTSAIDHEAYQHIMAAIISHAGDETSLALPATSSHYRQLVDFLLSHHMAIDDRPPFMRSAHGPHAYIRNPELLIFLSLGNKAQWDTIIDNLTILDNATELSLHSVWLANFLVNTVRSWIGTLGCTLRPRTHVYFSRRYDFHRRHRLSSRQYKIDSSN